MILEFKIKQQDFLDFQLFTASKSERINKKKRKEWVLLTVGSILVGIYFYLNHNSVMAVYFWLVAIICGLFYPRYFKWRYKKHYKTYIQENYSKRFGQLETIEIKDNAIFSKDKIGEGKINLSEIERIDETDKHFFIKISSGMSLIIPKGEINGPDNLRQKFQELGITLNVEINWDWK